MLRGICLITVKASNSNATNAFVIRIFVKNS